MAVEYVQAEHPLGDAVTVGYVQAEQSRPIRTDTSLLSLYHLHLLEASLGSVYIVLNQ